MCFERWDRTASQIANLPPAAVWPSFHFKIWKSIKNGKEVKGILSARDEDRIDLESSNTMIHRSRCSLKHRVCVFCEAKDIDLIVLNGSAANAGNRGERLINHFPQGNQRAETQKNISRALLVTGSQCNKFHWLTLFLHYANEASEIPCWWNRDVPRGSDHSRFKRYSWRYGNTKK